MQGCTSRARPWTYQARDGSTRTYHTHLLRRSYREAGKVKKETLANLLGRFPEHRDRGAEGVAVRPGAGGRGRYVRNRAVIAARARRRGARDGIKAGAENLLGPDCPERDLAYGLIIARAVAPASKLATIRWWADTTLGADLGIDAATTDEVYGAMDWLLSRQTAIKPLAARHLEAGGLALFDLSSAWLEGHSCRWGRSGIPGTGRRTGSRSSSAWSPAGPGSRSRSGYSPGIPPIRWRSGKSSRWCATNSGWMRLSWSATAGRSPRFGSAKLERAAGGGLDHRPARSPGRRAGQG